MFNVRFVVAEAEESRELCAILAPKHGRRSPDLNLSVDRGFEVGKAQQEVGLAVYGCTNVDDGGLGERAS
jgi:hypothetical protein